MKQYTEIPYWITLAHLPKWGAEKINRLVVKIIHDYQMTLEDFFQSENEWQDKFGLSANEISDLRNAKTELPNNAFLAEDLLSQGFEVIPISSDEYSKTLKNNLKVKAPTVLYIKGNKKILLEESIAIVGSRNAEEVSLKFADNIAKSASKAFEVVVSGFAKGVDKQALDSALHYKGQSIIVLPQGVMTFGSGIKQYYKSIVTGDVLVLSVFHPKSAWSSGLAMARNPIIYALASKIYVAQSSDSGGTWSGVLDGLKKGRIIFVRKPAEDEINANLTLIEKGAKPVDMEGNLLETVSEEPIFASAKETDKIKQSDTDWKNRVVSLLEKQAMTSAQILEATQLNMTEKELVKKLKTLPFIHTLKKSKTVLFTIKHENPTLFS